MRPAQLLLVITVAMIAPHFGAAETPKQDAPRIQSLDQLACMSWCELEQLYRQAGVGAIPQGYACGRPLYDPCRKFSGPRARMTCAVWHGKLFCPDGTLINQWSGFQAIRAQVAYGPSWLDGKQSIIMDYEFTSHVWTNVRDEMREVGPGIFLGVMYQRREQEPRLKMYFALQFPTPEVGESKP